MEKFIPYEKLSKKKQRELDLKRRGSWGGLNPVTRKPMIGERRRAGRRTPAPRLSVCSALFVCRSSVFDRETAHSRAPQFEQNAPPETRAPQLGQKLARTGAASG